MKLNAALIIASLAAPAYLSHAPAAQAMDQGFYVGGYFGSLERDANEEDDLAELVAISQDVYESFAFEPVSIDPRLDVEDDSWGFVAGYRWTPNLALELGYLQLGELKYRSDDVVLDLLDSPPSALAINTRVKTELSAITLSALGIWPLTYQWEIFGRLGLALTNNDGRVRLEAATGRASLGDSKDSADLVAGAGISYTFLDVYTLRGEAQRVFDAGSKDIGPQSDIDLLSLAIVVSF